MGTVQKKEEVLDILMAHRKEIENFGVRRLGLFGSFKKGTQDEGSDVDVLIEFVPGKKNFRNFIRLAFLLEDLLQRKVELVTVESLSPYLKPRILTEVEYVLQ